MPRNLSRNTKLDPKVLEIIDHITASPYENQADELELKDSTAHLHILYERLTNGREQALRPGMLAVWKRGLKNRRFPAYGEPAIVVEVLEQPVIDTENTAGWPYFREPLDLLLGIVDKDGDFLIYHADRRRFEPYEGAAGQPK